MATRITNEIVINGPIEQVFDLVTTTRYWTEWHPATIGVEGVVDRPIGLHDVIHERAQIGARVYEGSWQVVEHVRPTRVRLLGENSRISIDYTFSGTDGQTLFVRELEYDADDFRDSVPDPARLQELMFAQSQAALAKLKRLVEELRAAAAGRSSPAPSGASVEPRP